MILTIFKQPATDTVSLTDRVHRELEALGPSLPPDVLLVPGIYEQAGFIHRAIDNVLEAVRDGGILVVVILFIFLLNFRTTAITLTAIPLSIAITAIVFKVAGISINTMTLGGLAVAIGALVDDAIVDVENVFRRLRENRAAGSPVHPMLVIYRASSEVRKPILVGTLLVVVVYAAALRPDRDGGPPLRPDRDRVHRQHPRVPRRVADRHADPVLVAAARTRRRRRTRPTGSW